MMTAEQMAVELARIMKHSARGGLTASEAFEKADAFLDEHGIGPVVDRDAVEALKSVYDIAAGAIRVN